MLRHDETAILKPSTSLVNKVRKYAKCGGGIYRMNVSDFSYYCFTPFKDAKGKSDFCGGWSSRYFLKDTHFTHILETSSGKVYTKEQAIKALNLD